MGERVECRVCGRMIGKGPEGLGIRVHAKRHREEFERINAELEAYDSELGQRPQIVVLGFWELADWLPTDPSCPVVLDHVAPRLLERQFEDRERLSSDASALLGVLARCDEVWVGNARQRDLMTGWLLLAGHDCRFESPARIVPIAGDPFVDPAASDRGDGPLRLFHGGRDWPWRDASDWLQALRDADGPWRLDDGSEAAGLSGHPEYIERLRAADIALELSDDNVERRFSQSFRMTDALCNGVPVICNRFLPLADAVVEHEAGWMVDAPAEPAAYAQQEEVLDEIAGEAAERLGTEVRLTHSRKLCDLRPAYSLVFGDYVRGYDYWAYGDEDVFYGDLDGQLAPRLARRPDLLVPAT